MKKIVKTISLLILLLCLFAGCNSVTTQNQNNNQSKEDKKEQMPKKGGEVVIGYYSDASSLDPLRAASGGDDTLLYFIYENLINYGPEFEPLPGLAESWETQDNKTWTFHLRKGVSFHDGTPFDAEAVKFNLERANSDVSIKSDLNMIKTVEVVDSHTVMLHLSEPNSGLLQNLMTAAGMIVSPAAVEKFGDEYASHPTGTGPFKLVEHNLNHELRFEKFNEYWLDGKPYLDKVVVKVMEENTMVNALKSGEVDVVAPISVANMKGLQNTVNIFVDASPSLNHQYMFINTSLPPLDNNNVRLAMQYAMDREMLVEAIQFGNGESAYSPFPKNHPAYSEESVIPHDKEKAKKLLQESGVSNLSFDILVKPDAFSQRVGDAVKAQLAEVGIQVNLKPTEVGKLTELAFSNPQYPATIARASGRPDPNSQLSLYFKESSFYNPGHHLNAEFESLLQKAAAETDEAERMSIISQASQIVMKEDAMGIPLFFEPMIVAMSDKVAGYEPNLYGKPRFPFLWIEE
jgi:peptide/nickel transport system substrate-binding protein